MAHRLAPVSVMYICGPAVHIVSCMLNEYFEIGPRDASIGAENVFVVLCACREAIVQWMVILLLFRGDLIVSK